MSNSIPVHLREEQAAVEAEIRSAFRDVTRAGGVSWSEAEVIDRTWGDESEQAAARAKDAELRWEDLVESPTWSHESGMGGFTFLDPIGFRYYLAPAMIRCLRDGDVGGLVLHLAGHGKFCRSKFSVFTAVQSRVVARFLRLMVDVERSFELPPQTMLADALEYWSTRGSGPD